jgi:hypothetical protein
VALEGQRRFMRSRRVGSSNRTHDTLPIQQVMEDIDPAFSLSGLWPVRDMAPDAEDRRELLSAFANEVAAGACIPS